MDVRAVGQGFWLPFALWAAAVIGVSLGARQPGVVCMTPLAWFLALWVGLRTTAYSRSTTKASRMIEAALAGSILGLLQGLLFTTIVPLMGSIRTEERQKSILITLIMIGFGTVVSALLALAIGATQTNRRQHTEFRPRNTPEKHSV